jgi:excisionase family DNA binding protein
MAQQLDRDWFTLKQTADYLQCSTVTVMRLLRQGRIAGSQLCDSGKWRIRASSIERMMERSARRGI